MAALTNPTVRKWLSFGSGCGIVMGPHHLDITAVTVRPTGVHVAGVTRIERYRERPASEWGAEYGAFLSGCGLGHVAALVVLPRESVILRTISLPGVNDNNAAAAVQFQLEGLHPFPEDEAVAAWQRLGDSPHFLVAVAERSLLDETQNLFIQAGVKLSGITVSAGALQSAVRLLGEPPAEGFVAAPSLEAERSAEGPGPIEIYGESPSRPVFSGVFEMTAERAASIAVSELRLAPETELKDVLVYLPAINGAPEGYDFSHPARSRGAMSYAAAAVAACPHLCSLVNLLPLERRASTSRLRYIPTAALAVALLICGIGLLFEGGFEDRRYLSLVDAEIKKIEPKAARIEAADRETQALLERITVLDEFRTRPRQDLDALLALTRTVPVSGYASGIGMNRDAILIGGVADQAEGLVKALDASPFFESSEFAMPLTRNPAGLEMFRIRTVRTKGAHQ